MLAGVALETKPLNHSDKLDVVLSYKERWFNEKEKRFEMFGISRTDPWEKLLFNGNECNIDTIIDNELFVDITYFVFEWEANEFVFVVRPNNKNFQGHLAAAKTIKDIQSKMAAPSTETKAEGDDTVPSPTESKAEREDTDPKRRLSRDESEQDKTLINLMETLRNRLRKIDRSRSRERDMDIDGDRDARRNRHRSLSPR